MPFRIFALLACLLLLPSRLHAAPTAAEPDPEFAPRIIRAEFDRLYRGLQAAHYDLYARRSRAEYDALHARLRAGFDRPLRRSELRRRFQRFVAFGRIAHARIDGLGAEYEQYRAGGGRALALELRIEQGRAHVVRVPGGHPRIRPGDELLALDGRPWPRLRARLGRNISADHPRMLHTLLAESLPALLWQEYGAASAYRLRLAPAGGGAPFEATLAALDRAALQAAEARQPPAHQPDWNRREAKMLPGKLAYLRPGPFYDSDEGAADPWDNTRFVQFVDQAFESFLEAGAERLLVDLRDNPGGDNSFSDPMLAWFADRPFRFCSAFRVKSSVAAIESNAKRLPASAPGTTSHLLAAAYARHPPGQVFEFEIPLTAPRAGRRFEGQVWLLVNRQSYSNTVTVAALAQDYGFATVLGEETSDLATTYGAMEQFSLPRSGIVVGFPKALIVRPNGDKRARGVLPDRLIETPLLQGREDPVLQRALEMVRE